MNPACCDASEDINWLPTPMPNAPDDGHYKPFEEVFGTTPTDDHVPSIIGNVRKVTEEQQ